MAGKPLTRGGCIRRYEQRINDPNATPRERVAFAYDGLRACLRRVERQAPAAFEQAAARVTDTLLDCCNDIRRIAEGGPS